MASHGAKETSVSVSWNSQLPIVPLGMPAVIMQLLQDRKEPMRRSAGCGVFDPTDASDARRDATTFVLSE